MLAADGRIDPPERRYFSEVLNWTETVVQSKKLVGLVKIQEAPDWHELVISNKKQQ